MKTSPNKLLLLLFFLLSLGVKAQVKYYKQAEVLQDLDFFYEKVKNIHPVFHNVETKKKWDQKYLVLKNSIPDSLNRNQFFIKISTFLAHLNDGHTGVFFPSEERMAFTKNGGKIFPFELKIEKKKLIVAQYLGKDSTLFEEGEQILEINGIKADQMIQEMQKLYGNNSTALKQKTVAHYFRFLIWILYDFNEHYDILVKNKKQEVHRENIAGINEKEFKSRRKKEIPKKIFGLSIDEEMHSAHMQIRSFAQLNQFCAFADSAFTQIRKKKVNNLILDVRDNGGGRSIVVDSLLNYLTRKKYALYDTIQIRNSQELQNRYKQKYPEQYDWLSEHTTGDLLCYEKIQRIPERKKHAFKGNLFLLINRYSYSAAATFAGLFKELKLGKIVGEETGGSIEYYGDFWYLKTPHLALYFYVAPKRFVQYGGTDQKAGVLPDYSITDQGDKILKFTYDLMEKK